MTPPRSWIVEGKKFLWDGRIYPSREEAAAAGAAYQKDGFETCAREQEGNHLVFTRRVVKQVAVEQPR